VKAQKLLGQTQDKVKELQRDAADKAEEARRVFLRQVFAPWQPHDGSSHGKGWEDAHIRARTLNH